MSIVLVLAFVLVPLVLTAALTPVALALFPRFRSRESKPQSSQVAFATRTSSRLPLVGGPILALAIAMGVLFHPDAPLWPLAAIAGFFAFGLIDDLAKTLRGRGIGEGLYFAVIVLLSIAAALLILGRDSHHLGTLTPFALATHVGTDAVVTLGVWYVVLILGTTLAAGFSDGMDGLTAGAATILMTGLWLAAGPVTGVWAGLTAAGAGGALVWNLPSRWAPSARDRPAAPAPTSATAERSCLAQPWPSPPSSPATTFSGPSSPPRCCLKVSHLWSSSRSWFPSFVA